MLFFVFPLHGAAQSNSIQQLIDKAEPGETIVVKEGIYEENFVIDKSVHLIGNDEVIIRNKTDQPIITIQTNNAKIEHMTLEHDTSELSPAIFVQGNENILTNLNIDTNSLGIKLDGAEANELYEITIEGKETTPINQRQHGIDLWRSSNNLIYHNTITHVQDGVYVESSDQNKIFENYVANSRYGYHLMFTEKTTLERNESYENISGMMVMGTKGTQVKDNILKYNQRNVQSLGLLLFDVRDATITDNEIAHNRIGILIEDAYDNEITKNMIRNNYIGVQFKRAENNTITKNSFVANVVQGQAEASSENSTNENYWGDHFGLDITGNNTSDLSYEIDPFYLHLTDEYPPYRLLFDSPGMIFLENLLHTPAEERLIDLSPLMEDPFAQIEEAADEEMEVLIYSSLFFAISLTMIYMGVRKR